MSARLYDNIVTIVGDYLGPAAPRFVDRQITFHLNKSPEDVTSADMQQLTEWIKVSMALLTSERKLIDDCVSKLTKLHE